MNWTTEVPKESGFYWAMLTSYAEILYLAPDIKTVWVIADGDSREIEDVVKWANKLEIPE